MTGRGLGIAVAFERVLPPAVRELFAALTYLGDAGVLLAAVALYYWLGDRERGAFVLAATLGALALTLALKGLFALPRPPNSIQIAHATGYGFPSGHAIGATVVWGVLALALERGTHRARILAAAVAIGVISLSRVVIGVHYAVDVIVGVAVGITYLAVLIRVTKWRVNWGFAIAATLALAALATNDIGPDVIAAVAGVFGAAVTWVLVEREPTPTATVEPVVAVSGLALLAGVGYAGNALGLSLPAVFGLNLVIPAGILALPLLVERVRKNRSARPT